MVYAPGLLHIGGAAYFVWAYPPIVWRLERRRPGEDRVLKNLRQRSQADTDSWHGLFYTQPIPVARVSRQSTKRADTVGEPPSAEIGVSYMPSLKAKMLGKLTQEKVLLEL